MNSKAACQFADLFRRFVAALTYNVRCAELPGQLDPIRPPPKDDYLLSAESLRPDDTGQSDRAIADDGGFLPRSDFRGHGGVVTGPHHVRESEQRGHQSVIFADG